MPAACNTSPAVVVATISATNIHFIGSLPLRGA
jgi:hypothetical protein